MSVSNFCFLVSLYDKISTRFVHCQFLCISQYCRKLISIILFCLDYSNDWQSTSASTEQTTLIRDLLPASVYLIRVLAENELGAGEPSDHILFRTEGEAPTGEPQSLKIVSLASNQLKVTWEAPLRELWNGEILGYYIGYRDHGLV